MKKLGFPGKPYELQARARHVRTFGTQPQLRRGRCTVSRLSSRRLSRYAAPEVELMVQAAFEEKPLELLRHKFTVDDLDRMLNAGILGPDDKVELLEGEFIDMNSIGDPHIWAVRRLTRLLVPAIGDRAWVNVALPIRADRYSEPEPDISIQPAPVTGSPKLPVPHLVIEVSDSSLRKDRVLKQRIYSRARVPEYWIVNVVDFQIEVHTNPEATGYAKRVVHPRDATLRVGAFPDVEVPFAEILSGL